MESVRKDIECYFGRLKQRFRVLKVPNNFRKKVNIDDMMFTLVDIQNMILEWKVATNEYQSWELQANWPNINLATVPEMNCIELEHAIDLAEKEDMNEEEAVVDHFLWWLPKICKKNKNNAEIHNNDGYHDVGTDFLFIVIWGQDHAAFGWMDWGQPDEPEKRSVYTETKTSGQPLHLVPLSTSNLYVATQLIV